MYGIRIYAYFAISFSTIADPPRSCNAIKYLSYVNLQFDRDLMS